MPEEDQCIQPRYACY